MRPTSSIGRVLITGAKGQVGAALIRTLAPLGDIIAPLRERLNLADPNSVREAMREFQPRWVVNAAAHTDVDKAESEPELAFATNATAPGIFAEEAKRIGAALIHFSTDYVFDGSQETPYIETDPTGPLNVYGLSKLAGEISVSASDGAHLVFRTSWVYGAAGKNFLSSILRLARESERLEIVAGQRGAPTWSFDLALMTAHVITQVEAVATKTGCSLQEATLPLNGIYHAGGSGVTTRYGLATEAIAKLQKLEPNSKLAVVEPIPTAAYPTLATRPLRSQLDCTKLENIFHWRMPDWHDSVAAAVEQLNRVANPLSSPRISR